MRSNDVIFGYKNDYAWQQYVLYNLAEALSQPHAKIEPGKMIWQVQNLHVYERHFGLIEDEIKISDMLNSIRLLAAETMGDSHYARKGPFPVKPV